MNLNEDSKCRLCLSTNITLVNVVNYQQLLLIIKECLNIQIKDTDKFPKTVCSTCIEKIQNWHSFKGSCWTSQELLKYENTKIEADENGSGSTVDEIDFNDVKEVIKIELDNGNTLINSDLIVKIEHNFDAADPELDTIDFIEGENDLSYQCDVCCCEFENTKTFLEHVCRGHQDDEHQMGYKCKYCCEEYEAEEYLQEHVKEAHAKVSCKICSNVMLRTSLKAHVVSHSDRFKCPHCSHKFGNSGNLKQHIINVHTDIKNYVCELCSKRFASKANLNVHMKSHKETRDYKCNVCDYRGRTRSAVYSHMFTHNAELLSCMYCGKLYKGPAKVASHIKLVHMDLEKKFMCSYCPKNFLTNYKRKVHERIHTGDRPFSCKICNKSFKRSDSLKEHIGVHGLGRASKCTNCSKNFVNKSVLLKHKLKCKGKEKPKDIYSD